MNILIIYLFIYLNAHRYLFRIHPKAHIILFSTLKKICATSKIFLYGYNFNTIYRKVNNKKNCLKNIDKVWGG